MTLGPQFHVFTQHGEGRETRKKGFDTFDEALSHAKSTDPDKDGSMWPNVDESLVGDDYEKGVFWHGNRYAVITNRANRQSP